MTAERDALAELVALHDSDNSNEEHDAAAWSAARFALAAQPGEICGDRGFAGPSCCTLPRGHSGGHKYGVTAQPTPQEYPTIAHLADLSRTTKGYQSDELIREAVHCWHAIAALRAENERQAREISRVKEHLTRELTVALAERDALRLMVKDDAQWAQENERLTRERDELRTMLRTANAAAAKLATIADHAKADLFKANIDSANLLAERSDMSVDIEKYRREIAELKSELNETQRAGVTTANYWKDRAELAEDQRERTRDVWATRAERAEAKVDHAERIIAAADAMRHKGAQGSEGVAYDRERAEWKP